MSIHKKYGELVMTCDNCQAEIGSSRDFQELINEHHKNGGRTTKVANTYYHYCNRDCYLGLK